ncbi:hypothetical protein QQX98_010723 [Neonectria punicea]|uniref:FAD-binding PCMH-type domain-containing protein n=1 Tax=Neonectria punicea TaxID=979145 RepID=A0ABR1GP27_9HYPO
MPLRVKNGGHSDAGSSTINEGILLDLVNMKRVDLDIESKTVTLQGARFGAMRAKSWSTAIMMVTSSTAVDVLLWEATVVTADGSLVTVKDSDARDSKEDWPDRITIDSSWLCDLQQKRTEPAVRFLVYHDGTKSDFDRLINQHLGEGELAKQLKRRSVEEKSTRFLHETLVTQWSEETTKGFPSNPSYSIYTPFVFKNQESKIREMTAITRDEMRAFRELFNSEQVMLKSGWRDMREFLQTFNEALRKYSMSGRAAFINFPDEALVSETHDMAYFGHNHLELREIKKI